MSLLPRFLTQALAAAISRWFAKRAPKSDCATLNLRNVYIFFSREGLLFLALLMITFIAGVNYGNNLILGLCFYLVSIWLISFHVTFAHISGLQVKLLEITMAEAGSPVWVTLQVQSGSRQPRRQLSFSFDPVVNKKHNKAFSSNDNQAKLVVLSSLLDEQIIRLAVTTSTRGQLELPRLKIQTVYPLGIMRAWSYIYFARTAWVYPKPLAFDWQARYTSVNTDDLSRGSQHTQGQDDFDRLDSYIQGESLARVSWAHVARGQGMLTKHFVDPLGHEHRLDYHDMPASTHEQKLAQLAFGALSLGRLNVPFQMQLSSDTSAVTNTLGQGEPFTQTCLLRLAKTP